LAGLLLPAGCRTGGSRDSAVSIPANELRLLLDSFNKDFSTAIQRMSDLVVNGSSDPATQRNAMTWKMRLVPLCRSFMDHPEAKVTFIDTWALCAQIVDFVDSNADAEHGDTAGLALIERQTVDGLVKRVENIGNTFLTPTEMEETRILIESFADDHEIGERFFAFHRTHGSEIPLGSFMTSMVATPLSKLNPFGGVSETAVAIHEVSESANAFRDAVVELPDILRWQVELAMHDLRNSEQVASALASIAEVAKSTTEIGTVAEALPDELRRTLEEANGTVERLEPLVLAATELMENFTAAGTAWVTTIQALQEMLASMTGANDEGGAEPAQASEPVQPARPFDILEYAETAEQLTAAANELHGLLDEVRTIAGGEEINQVASTVDSTARSAIDHMVLRIGELVLVIVAALIVLRAVWSRTRRR
ncbi:MAG: hypothetical protein ACI8QZ_003957, partial [Chlamydiales bacterium]